MPLRLLARTPARAPVLPGCVVLASSSGDGDRSVAALRGVSTLFMASAAEDEDRVGQHRAFVAAAAQAGVAHVVYTSFADVARVATAVLREPEKHRGAAHELTGPEALSFRDVAEQVPAATGRPVTYHDESPEEAYAPRAPYGAPRWQVDAWLSTF